MKRLDRFSEMAATGLGAGCLPLAPGTWGSLEAIALAWAVHSWLPGWEFPVLAALAAGTAALGVWAASETASRMGEEDPSRVVIDEIAGQLLALLWIPLALDALFAGFLLFRLFDIFKPFPAGRSERLPGGWGIMADDLIAGAYAGAVLYLLSWLGWL